MTKIVCVVGAPGVGKTYLASILSREMVWPVTGIDVMRARGLGWGSLDAIVRSTTVPLIVETVLFPTHYQRALRGHEAKLLVLHCPEWLRLERLQRRGETRAARRTPTYTWPAIRRVDSSRPIDIDGLVSWIGGPLCSDVSSARSAGTATAPCTSRPTTG